MEYSNGHFRKKQENVDILYSNIFVPIILHIDEKMTNLLIQMVAVKSAIVEQMPNFKKNPNIPCMNKIQTMKNVLWKNLQSKR